MSTKKIKKRIGLFALNVFFIIICFVGLVPILYAFTLSVSGDGGALTSKMSILPTSFTLKNYAAVFRENRSYYGLRTRWSLVLER